MKRNRAVAATRGNDGVTHVGSVTEDVEVGHLKRIALGTCIIMNYCTMEQDLLE